MGRGQDMRTWAQIGILAFAALLAAGPAVAQQDERGMRHQRSIDEPRQPPHRFLAPREFRRDEQPERGRLSPEERRQLRRDIQDAGQDIYHRGGPNRRHF